MEYCFIKEDLIINDRDPLCIQKQYAHRLKRMYIADLKEQSVFDWKGERVNSLVGRIIFLRCSYDLLVSALRLLDDLGADVIENIENLNMIENWFFQNISQRSIKEYSVEQLYQSFHLGNRKLADTFGTECIFVKSKKKGFSTQVKISSLTDRDARFLAFINRMKYQYGDSMLVSKYFTIRNDSLGPRETRHIILDGKLVNSSRMIHSLRHTVPKSHMIKAKEIADYLCKIDFPKNYVLDLGEFKQDASIFLDVVEINPISCSLCYVNNSIFTELIPEIEFLYCQCMFGYEYCYDYLNHPHDYSINKSANGDYAYKNEQRYIFD